MARPIAEGLFTPGPNPRLIGGKRRSDGRVVFPAPSGPEAQHYERIELSPTGSLWSYTVQRFRPKSPPYAGDDDDKTFKPFAIGYVELPGQVIVESRLAVDDFSRLKVGQPMGLTLVPFRKDSDGQDVVTFAFQPLDQGA
jgi:uncharacterized OB-fold protein